MTVDIGACGSIGIAREATAGTYVAPTKFFPLKSETLKWVQDIVQRRGIRQVADVIGAIQGNYHVEGDIEMEAFEEVIPYFLMAGRTNTVKTGTTDYTYTITGAHCSGLGTLGKTLSVTVVRNGVVSAYTGIQVSSFEFSTSDGVLMFKASCLGLDEATQTDPSETYPTTQVPYGPGKYSIEIPTATVLTGVDAFTFTVNDNLAVENRLRNAKGPAFLRYGERTSALTLARDFENRTEFDAFKAMTAQAITLSATISATNSITILLPVATKETYEFNLSGQGDLIRAQMGFFGGYDATVTASYKVTVKTQENIT